MDIQTHFYRTTLCVSVVFALAWCLYDCIQMTEDIVKLLSQPIILVF